MQQRQKDQGQYMPSVKRPQVVIVSSPRSGKNAPQNYGQHTSQNQQQLIQQQIESHRSSHPQTNSGQMVEFAQSQAVGQSDQHLKMQQTASSNPKDLHQQQQVKTGRIGIFGNYLATRISSIQQQKFLLQSAGAGMNQDNSAGGENGNPLSSRRVSAHNVARGASVKIEHQNQLAGLSVTQGGLNFMQGPSATIDGQKDKNNPQQPSNSFIFGSSNFGSLSSDVVIKPNNHSDKHQQNSAKHKKEKQNQSAFPFSLQGQTKAIYNKDEQQELAAKQNQDKKNFVGHSRQLSGGDSEQLTIAHLPMVKRDFNNYGQQSQNADTVNTGFSQIRQSVDSQPKTIATTHLELNNQTTSETAAMSRQKQNQTNPQQSVYHVNKSYQGGLTKLLKQVKIDSEQHQRTPSLQPKNNSLSKGLRRGPTFFNSAQNQQQTTLNEAHQKRHQRQIAEKQRLPTKSPIHFQTDERKIQQMLAPLQVGNRLDQKYSDQQAANTNGALQQYEDNYYTVSKNAASFRPHNSSTLQQQQQLQNTRSQSHTPVQDQNGDRPNGGDISPMQVRETNQYGATNSIGKVHRSYEQRTNQNQQQSATKKPLIRDNNQGNLGSNAYISTTDKQELRKEHGLKQLEMSGQNSSALSSQQVLEQLNVQKRDDSVNKNLPINSKLNAALRHNGRPGLGPCLEDRQLNLIDKIWGNFNNESSQDNLRGVYPSARTDNKIDKNQNVQLIKPNAKRIRNENFTTHSEEKSSVKRAVFLQNQSVKKYAAQTHKSDVIDNQRNGLHDEAQTPVWLPKKTLIPRVATETDSYSKGSKNMAAEQAALALHQAADENFDYKDFNFIVGKNKQPSNLNNHALSGPVIHNSESHRARSNSPSNTGLIVGRYDQNGQLAENSDSYQVLQKQYGSRKRQSTELLKSAQIYMDGAVNPGGSNQPASIKIQIEDSAPVRKNATDSKPAYYHVRQSQMNLQKQESANSGSAYISHSQKKKNQQYWQVQNARQAPKEDFKQMYHVTIQIDPSIASPQNKQVHGAFPQQQHILTNQPTSPYQVHQQQQYSIIKQQAVPVKQHVIPGLSDSYNVAGQQYDHQAARRNGGAMSPRTMERQGNPMVFSPEPRLIELPGDEHKMKTIPMNMMCPILPKRQARPKGQSVSGLSQIEDKVGLEQCFIHHRQRVGHAGEATNSLAQSSETPFQIQEGVNEDDEIKVQEVGSSGFSYVVRKPRQPYICPYASAKLAKYRENREKQETRLKQKTGSQGDASATEESKTDLRTAEQKAEELKAHQKELLRKFLTKFPPKRLPNAHAELEEERQRFLQARKDANRKYTEISANNNKPGRFAPLKFVVFEGNNSQIIRRVMQSRLACNMPQKDIEAPSPTLRNTVASTAAESTGDEKFVPGSGYPVVAQSESKMAQNFTTWQETNAPHLFNFKWKPTSASINYERLGKFGYKQLVNHIEGHGALTTKDQLFYNMKAYCEKKNLDVYKMIPLTFAVDFQEHNYQDKFDQILQILSLFEKNVQLPHGELNQKLQQAQQKFDKVLKSPLSVGPSEHQNKNLWLLKPTGFNRGIGIHVFNSLEDLVSILWTHYRIQVSVPSQFRVSSSGQVSSMEVDQQAKDARDREIKKLSNKIAADEAKEDPDLQNNTGIVKEIKNSSFIVQKYIEAPLLFRKRKFDIRIWALIGYDGKFYLFKEAYVRTSSEEYDLSGEKLDQIYVHLTNNAVQKYSKNYGKFEEGNIVSVKTLSEELATQDEYEISQSASQIEKSLYTQMREQIQHSYEAVRSKMTWSKHTFELVGYDFMVVPILGNEGDSHYSFQTRLIEANTNPCLEESNQLLKEMIPRMLDDMLKLTVDPLFGTQLCPNDMAATETETGLPVVLNYPIEGYQNHQNMFELIASPIMP